MKYLFFLFIFSYTISFSQISAKVVGISDGDTITVLLEDNTSKKIRLAEVDCPEKSQAFGKNAKQFTSDQIFGKKITFIKTKTDRYGRIIAKLYYNKNKYLSEEIIRAGLGWWYFKYSKNKNLGILQNEAKKRRVGLWQDKKAIAPWEFRKLKHEKKTK